MPSTTDKKKLNFNGWVDESNLGGAGEALAEPALPLWARGSASLLGTDLVEEAIGRSRLRRAVADLDEEQRAELLDGLLGQLGSEHGELPEAVTDRLLDGLIAGKRGEAEILGQNGVLGELTRRLIERALQEELGEHLGY